MSSSEHKVLRHDKFRLSEYLNGTLATSSQVELPLVGQTSISTFATNVAQPEYMAFDSSGNLWFDAGNSATGDRPAFYPVFSRRQA